jgi:small redox-active disulfide protein 2
VDIKVLGPGCSNCEKLAEATRKAVERADLDATIEKVTDMAQILGYGVMSTPALVVDGQVRLAGRVPSIDDLVALLRRS